MYNTLKKIVFFFALASLSFFAIDGVSQSHAQSAQVTGTARADGAVIIGPTSTTVATSGAIRTENGSLNGRVSSNGSGSVGGTVRTGDAVVSGRTSTSGSAGGTIRTENGSLSGRVSPNGSGSVGGTVRTGDAVISGRTGTNGVTSGSIRGRDGSASVRTGPRGITIGGNVRGVGGGRITIPTSPTFVGLPGGGGGIKSGPGLGGSKGILGGGSSKGSGNTLGALIRNLTGQIFFVPALLSGVAYLAGLILGLMGILKLKEYIEQPDRTPIWEPVKRLVAGGMFFALPIVITAVMNTIDGTTRGGDGLKGGRFTGSASSGGLDSMIIRLMQDVFVPLQNVFGMFGYIAGIILVMVGISRLLKGEQEGPRGPAGIGTLMTFVVAGCLFSLNYVIGALVTSVFATSTINSAADLQYKAGLAGAEAHIHAVISAVIAFAFILGWISILKGLFQLRGVADGSQQASAMAATTHLIGGALAVNLGGIINAVQATLGIARYGITFG